MAAIIGMILSMIVTAALFGFLSAANNHAKLVNAAERRLSSLLAQRNQLLQAGINFGQECNLPNWLRDRLNNSLSRADDLNARMGRALNTSNYHSQAANKLFTEYRSYRLNGLQSEINRIQAELNNIRPGFRKSPDFWKNTKASALSGKMALRAAGLVGAALTIAQLTSEIEELLETMADTQRILDEREGCSSTSSQGIEEILLNM